MNYWCAPNGKGFQFGVFQLGILVKKQCEKAGTRKGHVRVGKIQNKKVGLSLKPNVL